MKLIFGLLALVAGLAAVPSAAAGDLIVSRSALEDATGALTISDVAARRFEPIPATLSKGFSGSAHWVRLQVRAPAKGNAVVLLVRQPFLNEIRLYEPAGGGRQGWKSRVTGNHFPYGERERARSSLGFIVDVPASGATYHLRLKTASVTQLTVEALEPAEADRKDSQLDLLAVFFATSMLLLLLWAMHSYLLDRLRVVGLFAVHQAVYTLYGIAVTGYLAPWLPDGFPILADLSTAVPYCAVNFTTLLFCRELFKSYEPPPLLMRGLNLFLLAFPIQLAAMALGFIPFAVILNVVLLRVTWWYFVLMTFTLRREQSPSRRSLQLFFVAVTLVFTAFWLVNSSRINRTDKLIGRQILIVNGLIIGGIFAMILNARSRRLLQDAQQSALELKAKSEFLALMSHEIRTPLNALVGFSAMARKSADPAKIDQYLGILEQSSRSLMEMVNDILDMSKIEAGRMELEAVPLDLRRLVGSLEEQYRHLADQKRLEFRMVVADEAPAWVLGDPVRLRQILGNLLSNALKFTQSGAVSCSVRASRPAEQGGGALVSFEVRDTGIGISEAGRALLFQPFRQLDATVTRKFGGTGLGLAIVRSLAAKMQGSIRVDSREGEGSCFVFELPLQEAEPAPDDPAPAAAPASAAVLVVEDNEFNRRLMGDVFSSWGQQVVLAEDGRQALQFMELQPFDLLLLDVRMPGIDGIEVARRVRLRERERGERAVPIIAVTADADQATREACLAAGIDAVLAKPVSPEKLAKTIAAHCQPAVSGSPAGELLLNAQTLSDLGRNQERARQYREMLQMDIEDELQCLQSALESGDRNDLLRAAHALKGLCGNLANPEAAKLAAWLQQNAASARPEQLRQVKEQLGALCLFKPAQEDSR